MPNDFKVGAARGPRGGLSAQPKQSEHKPSTSKLDGCLIGASVAEAATMAPAMEAIAFGLPEVGIPALLLAPIAGCLAGTSDTVRDTFEQPNPLDGK